MSSIEEKWAANEVKVALIKKFPGLFLAWNELSGRTVKKVMPLKDQKAVILALEDGGFTVAQNLDPAAYQILEGIEALRPDLQARVSEAYRALDEAIRTEKELARRARLEKIVGAIKANISEMPELKEEISRILRELS